MKKIKPGLDLLGTMLIFLGIGSYLTKYIPGDYLTIFSWGSMFVGACIKLSIRRNNLGKPNCKWL